MLYVHRGKLGDCIYSMYAVMKSGGGDYYLLTNKQEQQWRMISLEALRPLLLYQDYIGDVEYGINFNSSGDHHLFYDFTGHQTGNRGSNHLVYAHIVTLFHGDQKLIQDPPIHYDYDESWLKAPKTKDVDVIAHIQPYRGEKRRYDRWFKILDGLNYKLFCEIHIKNQSHFNELIDSGFPINRIYQPTSFLEGADYINSGKVFVGNVSCWNAVADGLKSKRLVDVGNGAHNANPRDNTGTEIQDISDEEVRQLIEELL